MSHNEFTGARMISKPANDKFESGWDRLWGNKEKAKKYLEDTQEEFLAVVESHKDVLIEAEGGPMAGEPAKELTEAELENWAQMMGHGVWEDADD